MISIRSVFLSGISGLTLFLTPVLRAQEAPRFIVSQEDVSDLDVLKVRNRLSVGFQLYSIVPNARPFQAIDGSNIQDFRYQISGAFGAEISYKLRTQFDLALSTAYELYESRLEQGTASTEFRTARMKLFPVVATARWQMARKFWAPEAELGFGLGIFNMSIKSTNLSDKDITDSSMSVLAHAAGGASFAWLDDTNLGFLVGYRMMFLPQKEFDAEGFDIRRKSLSGIYAKATLRYHF